MPISVRATFAQEGVFFAGEKLNCTITFTNSSSTSANGHHGSSSSSYSRPSSQLQRKPQIHQESVQEEPLQESTNGDGQHSHLINKPLPTPNNAQALNAANRDKAQGVSPTSPSSTQSSTIPTFNSSQNTDTKAQTRPAPSLTHNVVSNTSTNPENGTKILGRSDIPQQRLGVNSGRTPSQPRLSSDISHINAIAREPAEPNGGGQLPSPQPLLNPLIEDQQQEEQEEQEEQVEQEEQEEQEQTITAPPRNDDDVSSQPQLSPNSQRQYPSDQQLADAQLDDSQQSVTSPGLLGLATFMYRSASFTSIASAFGLSGGEQLEQAYPNDEKKLPPLPPSEHAEAETRQFLTALPPVKVTSPMNVEEKTTRDSLHENSNLTDEKQRESNDDPEQLARMGTPIGMDVGVGRAGHVRTATNGSTAGLDERMIELQVTDYTDTQSTADDTEYQTPRPSMDYSTRSSMQSTRGPFQQQYYRDMPTRRSSLMSNYSAHSSSRNPYNQGSKKEALLWGSVQVVGQFMVDGSFIRQQGFESLKTMTMYRPTGSSSGGAIGGGTLGTVNSSDWKDRANANRLFPVFSTPPSILFVDLHLAPGESTSYTYQIELPTDLPPSHRGKTIRFSYSLVLGVQRGSVHTPAKSVQLPFRLYNHISDLGTRPVYDLMSPVVLHKDTSISSVVGQGRVTDKPNDNSKLARKQFEDYVDELIRNIKPSGDEINPAQTREMTRRESDAYKDEEMVHSQTCLEKVSMLSRTASSASYDICKNNVPVAKLSLIKTRFKLGETVHGIISFISREIPTYQISVTLETVEAIEPSFACRSAAQTAKLTKRVHAELHESCIDTMRTSFALCIPPTATPEFKTLTLTLKWYLRVEFITGPANQPRFKMTSVDERRSQYHAVESLSTESFDCSVPIQVYPTSYETGALFPRSLSFNLA